MPRKDFHELCLAIETAIGADVFCSESYVLEKASCRRKFRKGDNKQRIRKCDRYVTGEIKVAIGLRMLAGGSYLDLVPLFGVSTAELYVIFDNFLGWILEVLEFPLPSLLETENWEELHKLGAQFGEKSGGVFSGLFGALDGLAIRIRCPRFDLECISGVPDPGNYYCRKGFYALNVQAICDKQKRILWCFAGNKGSSHDSTAFSNSRLHTLLKSKAAELSRRGLYLAGDSAYGLSDFMLVPYDTREMEASGVFKQYDAYNYHHSCCRIHIECAFGEVVMRWGILWRTLHFDLQKSQRIVNACMLLHNFIVERRGTVDPSYSANFDIPMDKTQKDLTSTSGEIPVAMVSDNNEPNPRRGPLQKEEKEARDKGNELRKELTIQLCENYLERPLHSNMATNKYGHVYMTA